MKLRGHADKSHFPYLRRGACVLRHARVEHFSLTSICFLIFKKIKKRNKKAKSYSNLQYLNHQGFFFSLHNLHLDMINEEIGLKLCLGFFFFFFLFT
jgi:hypothetical protein